MLFAIDFDRIETLTSVWDDGGGGGKLGKDSRYFTH